MRVARIVACVCCVVLFAPVAVAQEGPQPTPEHAKLDFWTGHWVGRGEMKPGDFGPGGPMSWEENCSWFGDYKFHVICKSEGTSPMGPMKGIGIIGYDAGKGVYTHYGVDSTGWAGYSEGTLEDGTWSFTSTMVMGGQEFMTRFSMKEETPEVVTFTWEISADAGKTWNVLMDGTSTKK